MHNLMAARESAHMGRIFAVDIFDNGWTNFNYH